MKPGGVGRQISLWPDAGHYLAHHFSWNTQAYEEAGTNECRGNAFVCVTAPRRPTARFARGLFDLSAFGEIHDHFLDIGLRELTLLLFVRLSGVAIRLGRVASMRSRRCLTDSAVIALRLKRLRDLQHMTQTHLNLARSEHNEMASPIPATVLR
ncbi:hypothetical protein [Burkholderia territorii]|uniref:hypothetical protein n=1 Tax=Burkholderia territorii TaxID=1503055 RepID=UPI0012D8BB6D|nr:hypothetical protein [Burkholderia territorii]